MHNDIPLSSRTDKAVRALLLDHLSLISSSLWNLGSHGFIAAGFYESNFIIDETHQIDLEFAVPKQSIEGFPQVELWIFPNKSLVQPNKVLELGFVVQARVPTATNPRSSQPTVLWNTNEDCVCLNLTTLSKKILRILKKGSVNESSVRLQVEVVRVLETSQTSRAANNIVQQDLCASLSQRSSNDSFLIIKNYNDSNLSPLSNPNLTRSKRDVDEVPSPPNVKFINPCGVVPLAVNLSEVYGSFIKAPVVTDVKDCSGRCTLVLDRLAFTKHGEMKERLKLLPGGEVFSDFEPCCMPVKFKPLHVLIRLKDESEVIVQLPDLVVDECACQ